MPMATIRPRANVVPVPTGSLRAHTGCCETIECDIQVSGRQSFLSARQRQRRPRQGVLRWITTAFCCSAQLLGLLWLAARVELAHSWTAADRESWSPYCPFDWFEERNRFGAASYRCDATCSLDVGVEDPDCNEPECGSDDAPLCTPPQRRSTVPGNFPTLRRALRYSGTGDTVEVSPGTYGGAENTALHFYGQEVTLESPDGPEAVTISCVGLDNVRGLQIIQQSGWSPETTRTVVNGVTVSTCGSSSVLGGAAVIMRAGLTIRHSRIADNTAQSGAGLYLQDGDVVVEYVAFTHNRAEQDGGAIYAQQSSVLDLTAVLIDSNQASDKGGGIYMQISSLNLEHVGIVGNEALSGGGIYDYGSDVLVSHSAVALNLRDGQPLSNNFACFSAGATNILAETDEGCDCGTMCNATGHQTSFVAPVTVDVGGTLLSRNRDRPFSFGMKEQSWLVRPQDDHAAWPLKLTLTGMKMRQFQYFVEVYDGAIANSQYLIAKFTGLSNWPVFSRGEFPACLNCLLVRVVGPETFVRDGGFALHAESWLGCTTTGDCNNHGVCIASSSRCSCTAGFGGVDCGYETVSVYSQLHGQDKTYINLQEAIWDAPSGDVLRVGPMSLTGPGNRDLGMGDRPLTVRGDGALRTIIDCQGAGQGFVIDGSYGAVASIAISGISIRNCRADTAIRGGNGGGVLAKSASLTLTSINIEGCEAELRGAGIYLEHVTSAFLKDMVISNNENLGGRGAGIHLEGTSVALEGIFMFDNWWAGAALEILSGNRPTDASSNGIGLPLSDAAFAVDSDRDTAWRSSASETGPPWWRLQLKVPVTGPDITVWTSGQGLASSDLEILLGMKDDPDEAQLCTVLSTAVRARPVAYANRPVGCDADVPGACSPCAELTGRFLFIRAAAGSVLEIAEVLVVGMPEYQLNCGGGSSTSTDQCSCCNGCYVPLVDMNLETATAVSAELIEPRYGALGPTERAIIMQGSGLAFGDGSTALMVELLDRSGAPACASPPCLARLISVTTERILAYAATEVLPESLDAKLIRNDGQIQTVPVVHDYGPQLRTLPEGPFTTSEAQDLNPEIQIRLRSAPIDMVEIRLTAPSTVAQIMPHVLYFFPGTYEQWQGASVTGLNDERSGGSINYTITIDAPVSRDMVYSAEVLRGSELNATNMPFRCSKRGEIANPIGTECLCDEGYELREGESDCAECQDGYYKSEVGSSACRPCVSLTGYEYVADEEKMKMLTTGGTGATESSQCMCRTDFYHTDPEECVECPEGANCTSPGMWLPDIPTQPGYWRSGLHSPWFYRCPVEAHCLGGIDPTEFCAGGTQSVECNTCNSLHGMSMSGCTSCDVPLTMLTTVAITLLGVFVLRFLIKSAINGAKKQKKLSGQLIKISVSFAISNSSAVKYRDQWPAMMSDMFAVQESAGASPSLGDFYAFDCFFSTLRTTFVGASRYYAKFCMYMMMPVLALLIPCIQFGLTWLRHVPKTTPHPSSPILQAWLQKKEDMKTNLWTSVNVLLFYTHPMVVKAIFGMFQCQLREFDEKRHHVVEMSILCDSEDHQRWQLSALFFLGLWAVGIPVYFASALWKNRDRLHGDDADELLTLRFGFLFNGYRKQVIFWEATVMLRKILYIAASVFLHEHEDSFQAGIALIITELSLILSIWVQPYEVQIVSTMESLSLITTFCTFIACLLISRNEVATKTDLTVVFFVVGVNLAFAVVMAFLFLKDSGSTALKKLQDSAVGKKVQDSAISRKLSAGRSMLKLPASWRADQTQVQSVEKDASGSSSSIPSKISTGKSNKKNTSKSQNGDLYPVIPRSSPSDTAAVASRDADPEQVMRMFDLGGADDTEDETISAGMSSIDSEDDDVEELRPHDQVRAMLVAKDDEIQELKLQLHTLERVSKTLGNKNDPSNATKSAPGDGSHIASQPAPPSVVSRIEDGLDTNRFHANRAELPMMPAASEESRIIDREIRHGRLTDHVKSSANRGDLESFIAATERIRSEATRVSHFKDAIHELSAHNRGFWDEAHENFGSDRHPTFDEAHITHHGA